MRKVLIILVCVVFVELSATKPTAQRDDHFFSLDGRFRIELPRVYAEWRPSTLVAAKQFLTIMIYKWNTTSGLITAGYAKANVDLEDPKLTDKVLRDVKESFVKQYEAKLLTEQKRVFDTHPSLEFIIENKSVITAVRLIVVKNRFYMLTLTNRPDQRDLMANGESLLSSFRLMPADEVVAIRNRAIRSLPDSPFSQDASGSDIRTDLYNENLQGRVKQIFVESETYSDGVLFGDVSANELKDFNEAGYATRIVTFSGQWPATVNLYGFANGSRVFKNMLVSETVWKFGRPPSRLNVPNPASLQVIKRKYDTDGRLIEQVVDEEDGKLSEQIIYKYQADRREITKRKYSSLFGERFETLSKQVERFDGSRNPIELTVFQYSQGPGGGTTTINKAVNPHDRVSGAITSGPLQSSSVKNNNREERTVVYTQSTQHKVVEEKYIYSYEFDAQGNWIKRVTTEKDKTRGTLPITVTYRTIIYY